MEESCQHCRGLRWPAKMSALKNLYSLSFLLKSIGESASVPAPTAVSGQGNFRAVKEAQSVLYCGMKYTVKEKSQSS